MKQKVPREQAQVVADWVKRELKPYCTEVYVCGSLLRGEEIIGDLDIILYEPRIWPLKGVSWLQMKPKTAVAQLRGMTVEFGFTYPGSLGAALLHATGPRDFNIGMRKLAKTQGMKLNQYGLFDAETAVYLAGRSEEDIFRGLMLEFIKPEDRSRSWIQNLAEKPQGE